MLASKYRLSGQRDLETAKRNGRVFQSSGFGMSIFGRNDGKNPRFVVVTSKKITKHATERNRIRRVFHDAIRYELTRIKPGFDVVFLTKKRLLRNPTDEIMLEIKNALKNSGLLQ